MSFDRKKKNKKRALVVAGVAAVAGIAALLYWPAGCSHQQATADGSSPPTHRSLAALAPQPRFAYAGTPHHRETASIADVAEMALPAVVNISSTRTVKQEASPFFNDPFFRHFFGGGLPHQGIPSERRQRSLGSGVIVSTDGVVLTNNHVVDHADTIKVTLSDRRELDAKVVGTDPQSDLAVLRLKGKPGDLHALELGNSARLRLGDVVLAIGDPFGVGETVTMGIVSAKGRANIGITDYEDFIQTDAAINPGNSGGALVDMQGRLVGINTAILSRTGGYQGIGFAIPSNMARPIMESLLKHGKVVRGYLGVAIQQLTPDLAHALGVKANAGVLISDVTRGTAADRAGVKRGDVVLSINGEKVETPGHLRNLVAASGVGAKVQLEILRHGSRLTKTAVLGEMPSKLARGGKIEEDRGPLGGLTLQGLDAAARHKFNVPEQVHGVVVAAVAPGSRAAYAGLRPGDVILEVNRKAVRSVDEFARLYKADGERTLLLVYRDGSTLYLLLQK
jgi:serine protease Do